MEKLQKNSRLLQQKRVGKKLRKRFSPAASVRDHMRGRRVRRLLPQHVLSASKARSLLDAGFTPEAIDAAGAFATLKFPPTPPEFRGPHAERITVAVRRYYFGEMAHAQSEPE